MRFSSASISKKGLIRIAKSAAYNENLLYTVNEELEFDTNLRSAIACEYYLSENGRITPKKAATLNFLPTEVMRLYDWARRGIIAKVVSEKAIMIIIAIASLLVGGVSCLVAIKNGLLYGLIILLSACGIYQICDGIMSKFPFWLGAKFVAMADIISKRKSKKLDDHIDDSEYDILDENGKVIETKEPTCDSAGKRVIK